MRCCCFSSLGHTSLFSVGTVADLPYGALSADASSLAVCCTTSLPLPLSVCVCSPQQEQRNILALAVGLKGIAAIRSVLSWAPVQAHATSHKVTAYYVTKSPQTAAFLAEWDQWREAGVSSSSAAGMHMPTTDSHSTARAPCVVSAQLTRL